MASKFQNRLVGTIILVALGVIILPGLLDGKKKHYQDEFAAIPLVPKPGDSDELDATPPASQQLPSKPPEGAGEAVEQSSRAAGSGTRQPKTLAPPDMKASPPAATKPEVKPTVWPESKPVPKPQTPKVEASKPLAPKPDTAPAAEQAPKGEAWVVQLGALKNADKVSEIVAKLRLSGYRVYTSPSAPVQGQITRIFVGPDASRDKLQSALGELNQLSGLNGQLRAYSVR
ncbi:cell division protein DedD [Sodalis glossinidius str. 'morsitans']|uniref:Cell division protein DedD n=1 Tax=Sodalis glossinidius (strain morsitans) TaxID=343509 RepID=Q2NSI5_SODGM|nr:cell division protein DedD [Sodalis glossinidius]BAE74890.1 putative lipoprotein [Sodalis glossinidius str. 'morsitans']CRL45737.1 cell division protein DedD [Sodalis glossinidius str. 'morsitans']